MADRLQMIYGYLPGVSKDRICQYEKIFQPEIIDFKVNNHRSSGNEILDFADAILKHSKLPKLKNIKYMSFRYEQQSSMYLKLAIRNIRKTKEVNYPSIAVFTRSNKSVRCISEKLNKASGKLPFPVQHSALVDEDKIRFYKSIFCEILQSFKRDKLLSTILILEELAKFHYCCGQSGKKRAEKILEWKKSIMIGNILPRSPLCVNVNSLVENLPLIIAGDIIIDVQKIRSCIDEIGGEYLEPIIKISKQVQVFSEHGDVVKSMNKMYAKNGSYEGIKKIEYKLSIKRRMLETNENHYLISVMNMNKSKGKEYDSIIFYHSKQCPLISVKDNSDENSIRELLRVAITRARCSVYFVYQEGQLPDLINPEMYPK